MSHIHSVSDSGKVPKAKIHRILNLIVIVIAVATVIGLVALWPHGSSPKEIRQFFRGQGDLESARVMSSKHPCPDLDATEYSNVNCLEIKLTTGPDRNERVEMQDPFAGSHHSLKVGDPIRVTRSTAGTPKPYYSFSDYDRKTPLLVLGIIFAVVVIVFARMQGVRALIGVGISLFVIIMFVLPAIVKGESAIAVSLVAATGVLLINLYLAHGINIQTTIAILGTCISLLIIIVLTAVFLNLCHITGLADEDATFLATASSSIDLRGLIFGGFIIGALGVIDDITVTQVSAVWQLRITKAEWKVRDLYNSASIIGRDHISSVVNTLVFAYVGAALPLMLLLHEALRGVTDVLNGEVVAVEVLRILIGSIGLVAAVPITTFLAAVVLRNTPMEEPRG